MSHMRPDSFIFLSEIEIIVLPVLGDPTLFFLAVAQEGYLGPSDLSSLSFLFLWFLVPGGTSTKSSSGR